MFQADHLPTSAAPAAPPVPATFPGRPRERWHRKLLLGAGALYQWIEVALDRLVSPAFNPLYHTGTIAVFSLAVATVTGIYLFLFYRVGTSAAHASVEAIAAQPLGIGSLMRSLHRYSSDAAILAAALHGLKMLLSDRFWGARWIGWVTGLALLALVWFTGATGYWLVWDTQALVLSMTTARFLDVLPFFAEPVVQTFLANDRIQNFLFFIVLFLHITVPLLIGAFYWFHVMRLSRARFFPPRVVLWVTGGALLLASLVRPALSGPPADPARLPGVVPVDWFFFAYFPLTRLDPRTGWAIVAGTALVALVLPWLFKGREPARATVETAACTGCTRCYKDCPYDAIVMIPRTDGARYKTEAVVNPARCVGCGICVGACDTGGILLGGENVGGGLGGPLRGLPESPGGRAPAAGWAPQARRRPTPTIARAEPALEPAAGPTRFLRFLGARNGAAEHAASRRSDCRFEREGAIEAPSDIGRPVLVFACRLVSRLGARLDPDGTLRDVPRATVLGLPCVGLLHPRMIADALGACWSDEDRGAPRVSRGAAERRGAWAAMPGPPTSLEMGAAGVFIAGCVPEDCQFREGSTWLPQRLTGARLPALKDVPEERVRLAFYSPVEVRRFLADLRAFVEKLP